MKQAHFSLKAFYTLCPPPLCLVNSFSVFHFLLLFFVFSGLGEVKGQNVINIYQDFEGKPSNWVLKEGYTGEYLRADERIYDHWSTSTSKCYSNSKELSSDMKIVSYPFWPDSSITDMLNSTNRILTVLSDDEHEDMIEYLNTGGPQVLATAVIFEKPDTVSSGLIPHTIYKTNHHIHCGVNINSPIAESVHTIVDLTRGRMREYPFNPLNNVNFATQQFDIINLPFFLIPDTWVNNNIESEVNYYPINNLIQNPCDIPDIECSENTINYFPLLNQTTMAFS